MPRGVEFTDQQRSVLSQIMRTAWARHKGVEHPKMTRRWVNPMRKKRHSLTIPQQHALRIARDSLRMPEPMLRVMGGPTKEQAREIIYELTGKWPKDNPGEAWHRARYDDARKDTITLPELRDRDIARGRAFAHSESQVESRRKGIPNPRRISKFKLSNLFFPALIIGGIIWLVGSSQAKAATGRPSPCGDMGDVDGDGFVTEADAKMVTQSLVSRATPLTSDQKRRADVNGDGEVTVLDALLIAQYALGNRDTFPVCGLGPV